MISLLQRRAGIVPSPLWSLRCCGLGAVLALSQLAQANNPPVSAPAAAPASSKPNAPVLTQDAQKKLMRNFGTGQSLDPVVMLQKGVSLVEANRSDEAVAAFNKMAVEYPQLPEPHNNLAVIYAGRGQQDKARLALEAALRTHPAYAVAMENLSQVYARQAKEAYAKALPSGSSGKPSSPAPTLTMMRHVVLPGLSVAPDLLAAVNSLTKPAVPTTSVLASAPAAAPTVTAATKPATPPAVIASAAPPAPKPTVVAAAPMPTPTPTPSTTPPVVASKPAAAPAAASAPTTAPDRDAQQAVVMQVRQAVAGWARAWSRQDMDAYFAAYTPEFDGGKTRKAWMDDRRNRITSKKSIEVNVSGISVVMEGNAATAHFKQEYASGDLQVTSGKRLRFAKVGDRWLIDKESVGS
jgi:ketosteroid isomerase-like protein